MRVRARTGAEGAGAGGRLGGRTGAEGVGAGGRVGAAEGGQGRFGAPNTPITARWSWRSNTGEGAGMSSLSLLDCLAYELQRQ